jgi:hypothetical protein
MRGAAQARPLLQVYAKSDGHRPVVALLGSSEAAMPASAASPIIYACVDKATGFPRIADARAIH